ncbi:hypothetical protein PCANC_26262 [Puccinia coronata f. sp. avenae]|uniref:Uncharacterized protein n=1 Tax=Puccinia coronata f. sp. avenae TaxID=200324 RepID=A0A2N5S2W2_9BASI|nr:hypothetical protein PCANC_26262 [Puccinia coronata f. sp. avenae]
MGRSRQRNVANRILLKKMTSIDRLGVSWLTLLAILVSLFGANLLVACQGNRPSNSSSTANTSPLGRTFTFERQVSWTNRDFLVREVEGKDILQVNARFTRPESTSSYELFVTNSQSHTFRIGLEAKPDIDIKLERCGYRQTYRTSDGIDYRFDPRGWLTDRWTIGGGILTEDYYWERNPMGLAGPIKNQVGRHVAHFHARKWGQEWVAMLWHSRAPHATTYAIETNDEIPIEYLVGLFTMAILRMDKCGR